MVDKKAIQIASNAVKGAATLAEKQIGEKNISMGALIDELCTPAGTTIDGILAAEQYGLSMLLLKQLVHPQKDQTLTTNDLSARKRKQNVY